MNDNQFILDLLKIKKFQLRILKWHSDHKRDLPWRNTTDPYKILISEFFLQRTQAMQVIPIYEKFIKDYPDIFVLARTKPKSIEKSMKSLGLAKKANYISSIANIVVKKHNGKIPNDFDILLSFPGIGVYTANSILCFAYEKHRPILDRNIARLISRVFNIPCKIDRAHTNKHLWEVMKILLPKNKAKRFNQALLDLEESICRPRSPKCNQCPIERICEKMN